MDRQRSRASGATRAESSGSCSGPGRSVRRLVRVGLALVTLLATLGTPGLALAAASPSVTPVGYDISFPECAKGYPGSPTATMIVGVNDGRAFTRNPCLADEYRWASSGGGVPALYMNLNYIESRSSDYATYGPRGHCAPSDNPCRAFNYGYNAAHDAVANATAVSANASRWWLDIEIANYWSPNPALNALVIQGAISYFREQQTPIGIYSIAPMWQEIAGAFSPDVPLWVAQTDDRVPTSAYCSPAHAFGGGAISLVQHWNGHVDLDYACPSLTLFQAQIPADGSARAPRPLDAQTQGTLPGRTGGNDTYFTVQSRGAGTHLSLRLYFWPNGVDVSNGVFITVFQNNVPITRIRGSDAKSPGEIALDVTLPTANPVVIQLANYNSDALPPLGYWLSPT